MTGGTDMTATYSNISSAAQLSADTLTIQGDGATLAGASAYRGLFAHSGVTTIENLTIENAVAEGGGGGWVAACSSLSIR